MQYNDRTSLVKFDEAVMEVVNSRDCGLKRVMNSILSQANNDAQSESPGTNSVDTENDLTLI